MNFFGGNEAEYTQLSNLTRPQLKLEAERRNAAKGGFKQSANYYKDILNDNPESFRAFEAPAQRQYNEEIIPDLAEQYAGMGAGNLSSSGFRNSAVSEGAGLSERLAAMRANLKQNAATNLYNMGQNSLQPHTSWTNTQESSPGFVQTALPIAGAVVGGIYGGPAGAAGGGAAGTAAAGAVNSAAASNTGPTTNQFGTSNPYGGNGYQGSFGKLPNYGQR